MRLNMLLIMIDNNYANRKSLNSGIKNSTTKQVFFRPCNTCIHSACLFPSRTHYGHPWMTIPTKQKLPASRLFFLVENTGLKDFVGTCPKTKKVSASSHHVTTQMSMKMLSYYLRIQFFLDCSVLPLVISNFQTYGETVHQQRFRISKTWCRTLHVTRVKALGRFNNF